MINPIIHYGFGDPQKLMHRPKNLGDYWVLKMDTSMFKKYANSYKIDSIFFGSYGYFAATTIDYIEEVPGKDEIILYNSKLNKDFDRIATISFSITVHWKSPEIKKMFKTGSPENDKAYFTIGTKEYRLKPGNVEINDADFLNFTNGVPFRCTFHNPSVYDDVDYYELFYGSSYYGTQKGIPAKYFDGLKIEQDSSEIIKLWPIDKKEETTFNKFKIYYSNNNKNNGSGFKIYDTISLEANGETDIARVLSDNGEFLEIGLRKPLDKKSVITSLGIPYLLNPNKDYEIDLSNPNKNFITIDDTVNVANAIYNKQRNLFNSYTVKQQGSENWLSIWDFKNYKPKLSDFNDNVVSIGFDNLKEKPEEPKNILTIDTSEFKGRVKDLLGITYVSHINPQEIPLNILKKTIQNDKIVVEYELLDGIKRLDINIKSFKINVKIDLDRKVNPINYVRVSRGGRVFNDITVTLDSVNENKSLIYSIMAGGTNEEIRLNHLNEYEFKMLMKPAKAYNENPGFLIPHPEFKSDYTKFEPSEMTAIFGNGNYSNLILAEDPYGRAFNELMADVKTNNIAGDRVLENMRDYDNEVVESIDFIVSMEGGEILTGKNVNCTVALDGHIAPDWYHDPELPSYEVEVYENGGNEYRVSYNFDNPANRWTWKKMLDSNFQFVCANVV